MKRFAILALVLLVLAAVPGALAAETRIKPAFDVPEYVQWVLDIASQEVGYREGAHGYTKYGEWAGDPYAQWCAESLTVDVGVLGSFECTEDVLLGDS